MSRRKLVKAVAAGHLVCRTLALLAQFGLLIVFIHISATDGGIMFAKYLYVIFAIIRSSDELFVLALRRHQLSFKDHYYFALIDTALLAIVTAIILRDYANASQQHIKIQEDLPVRYMALLREHFYLVYTFLAVHNLLIALSLSDLSLRATF